MHDSVLEVALKVASISPLEAALAAHLIVAPVALVLAPVRPVVDTHAFFDSVFEVSVVVAAI